MVQAQVLEQLVEQLPSNTPATVRAVREWLQRDPDGFRRSALAFLRYSPDSPGTSYLLAVLKQNLILLPALADPTQFPRDQAIDIAHRVTKLDPSFPTQLGAMLMELRSSAEADPGRIIRLLDVHGAITDRLNASLLLQFLAGSNSRLRSKAALLLGRLNQNVRFAAHQMRDDEPRVRANAIESIWGLDSQEAGELFRAALQDPHQRVCANAAVGLYRAGQVDSLRALVSLAASSAPERRASAAWAMGESSDPRFLPILARLLTGAEAGVRRNAFRAISRIRQTSARRQAAGAFHLDLLDASSPDASSPEDPIRRLRVAVHQPAARGLHRLVRSLKPLDFLLSVDGEAIFNYSIREVPEASSLAIALLWPSSLNPSDPYWANSIQALSALKRRQDPWSLFYYSLSASSRYDAHPEGLLQLGTSYTPATPPALQPRQPSDPQQAASFLRTPPAHAQSLADTLAASLDCLAALSAAHHVLLFADPNGSALPDCNRLVDSARQLHLPIYPCGPTSCLPPLAPLAYATGGLPFSIQDPGRDIPGLFRCLHGHYEISAPSRPGPVRLEISSDRGCGFATLDPPG